MYMNNYEKAKQLIKEGTTNTQDKLIDIMMDIKKNNSSLTHNEIIDLLKYEVDKFIKYHKEDRIELPKKNISSDNIPTKSFNFKDVMPIMKIPYGTKKNK